MFHHFPIIFPWFSHGENIFPMVFGATAFEGTVKFLFLAAKEQTGHGSYGGLALGKPGGCSDFLFFHVLGQGLVNVPFWEYWTSPYSSHYRPYT